MSNTTSREIEAYLWQFKNSSEIYQECRRKEIVGVPGDCRRCAVARLLEWKFGELIQPIVLPEPGRITVQTGEQWEKIDMTPALVEFARGFDNGAYRSLCQRGV